MNRRQGYDWGFTSTLLVFAAAALVFAAALADRAPAGEPLRFDGTRPASAEESHQRDVRHLTDLLRAQAGLPLLHETGAVAH